MLIFVVLEPGATIYGDVSPEPQVFFSELANNVSIVLFSGNEDALVGHRGTERAHSSAISECIPSVWLTSPSCVFSPSVAIQNTTFGGIQGFTRRPSTPFTDDEGNVAGIVHQERNMTYAVFFRAGHMVPLSVPKAVRAIYGVSLGVVLIIFVRHLSLSASSSSVTTRPASS